MRPGNQVFLQAVTSCEPEQDRGAPVPGEPDQDGSARPLVSGFRRLARPAVGQGADGALWVLTDKRRRPADPHGAAWTVTVQGVRAPAGLLQNVSTTAADSWGLGWTTGNEPELAN
jgi:hypothetical protein